MIVINGPYRTLVRRAADGRFEPNFIRCRTPNLWQQLRQERMPVSWKDDEQQISSNLGNGLREAHSERMGFDHLDDRRALLGSPSGNLEKSAATHLTGFVNRLRRAVP